MVFRSLCVLLFMLCGLASLQASRAQTPLPGLKNMSVYSAVTNKKIAEVPADARYQVLSDDAAKLKVQFLQPTVKGWVSADYVDINGAERTVSVSADALNFRAAPELDAPRMTQVYRGYTSALLDQQHDFVQIYAPINMAFLIDKAAHVARNRSSQAETATLAANPNWDLDQKDTENSAVMAISEQPITQAVSAAQTVEPTSPEVSRVAATKDSDSIVSQPDPAVLESNHLLAPGDSISLLVFGEPDLSVSNVRVPQGGRVSFPLIGSVAVLGKTTVEVEQEVAKLLSQGYVRNPRLSVSIFSYRPIFIRGEVKSTGSFPYSEGLTVAKAIALAGGVSAAASQAGVSITRDGVVVADGLLVDSQARVASGDIVSVAADQAAKDAESSYVYLHGEVAQPGAYEFQAGLTVEKAVVLAGGFTLRASTKKINVSRYESVSESGQPLELKRVKLYTPVKPGDVIKVGASWF